MPRGLSLVVAAVLLAHWGLLHGLPLAVSSLQGNAATVTQLSPDRPFMTRTILQEVPPAPQAVALPAASTAPEFKKKPSLAPVDIAQPAIESIANIAPFAAMPLDDSTQFSLAEPVKSAPNRAAGGNLAAAQAAQNYAFPGPVRLKYIVKGETKGIPLTMDGELLWLQDGKTYDARMEISHFLLGSIVQTSSGQLGGQGLEPVRFADKRRSEVAAHFDRNRGKIIFSANTPDADLLPGAQDQLSVFVQLAAMLGGEPRRYATGTEIIFQAVGPRSSEAWVFKVGETEKLTLPGGEVQAVKLSRPATGPYDSSAEIWLAPDMGYMPVRIRLTQANGDLADQQWSGTQKP